MVEKTVEWVSEKKDTNRIPSLLCLPSPVNINSKNIADLITFDYYQVLRKSGNGCGS